MAGHGGNMGGRVIARRVDGQRGSMAWPTSVVAADVEALPSSLAPGLRRGLLVVVVRHGLLLYVADLQILHGSPCLVAGPTDLCLVGGPAGCRRSPCRVAGGRSSGGGGRVRMFVSLARLSPLLLYCLVTGPTNPCLVAGPTGGEAAAKSWSQAPSLAGVGRR